MLIVGFVASFAGLQLVICVKKSLVNAQISQEVAGISVIRRWLLQGRGGKVWAVALHELLPLLGQGVHLG